MGEDRHKCHNVKFEIGREKKSSSHWLPQQFLERVLMEVGVILRTQVAFRLKL